jgi:hypothetical protein
LAPCHDNFCLTGTCEPLAGEFQESVVNVKRFYASAGMNGYVGVICANNVAPMQQR